MSRQWLSRKAQVAIGLAVIAARQARPPVCWKVLERQHGRTRQQLYNYVVLAFIANKGVKFPGMRQLPACGAESRAA
jgi:hypothetical protein